MQRYDRVVSLFWNLVNFLNYFLEVDNDTELNTYVALFTNVNIFEEIAFARLNYFNYHKSVWWTIWTIINRRTAAGSSYLYSISIFPIIGSCFALFFAIHRDRWHRLFGSHPVISFTVEWTSKESRLQKREYCKGDGKGKGWGLREGYRHRWK